MTTECDNKCRCCENWECRCSDCACLVEENGQWYCDEMQEYCKDITECIEFEE